MRAPGHNALLINLLIILVLYTLFACLIGFPAYFLYLFFAYLSTSLLPFSSEIGPLCFQATGRKRRPNPMVLSCFSLF